MILNEKPFLIFLVDDDRVYLKTMEHYLLHKSKYRLDVRCFESGDEAVHQLNLKPDVLVVDMFLGDHQWYNLGIQLFEEIKEKNETAEMIMMTVFDSLDMKMKAKELGIHAYLIKNEEQFQTLTSTIDELFDSHAAKAATA